MSETVSGTRIDARIDARIEARTDTKRFVTFPLGERHFALDSSQVQELVMPGPVYAFPHTMRSLEGVLIRRGAAIPVCDLGEAFGHDGPRSLYVIARCNYAGGVHTVAIPVSGSCELVRGERHDLPQTAPESAAPQEVTFVAGLLRTGNKTVPMLDLDRVVSHCINPSNAVAREAKR
jgi:chemotaxis signal transduction protein